MIPSPAVILKNVSTPVLNPKSFRPITTVTIDLDLEWIMDYQTLNGEKALHEQLGKNLVEALIMASLIKGGHQ